MAGVEILDGKAPWRACAVNLRMGSRQLTWDQRIQQRRFLPSEDQLLASAGQGPQASETLSLGLVQNLGPVIGKSADIEPTLRRMYLEVESGAIPAGPFEHRSHVD